ncbi:MAG TPA: HEAT repeat domain-containing protein [Planctomycetota bacterium]|nr:HEAT repeat domain-containing protein [Planctomycetota bacterium]
MNLPRPFRPLGPLGPFLLACALLTRAAEPPLTPDQAFEQVKAYDYGQPDRALHFLELEIVRAATDAPKKAQMAERLGAILADAKATHAARVWCCQQLLLVGTEAQVPLLVKTLDDEKTAEIARFTLQGIRGEASLAALRTCLAKFQGMPLVGAVNSLGIRRDAKSVVAIAKLLTNSDPLLAAAAAEALGKIGNAEAATALAKAELPARQMGALHDAQLRCAQLLAAGGDAANAEKLYEQVWASSRPVAWRLAGLAGLTKVSKEKATPLVLDALGSEDPLIQASAVQLTKQLPGEKVTAALVQRLEKLDASGQALLLDVLAERGDRSAAPGVAKRMEAKDDAVRAAAVRAMGNLGDSALIHRLGALAATERGLVQQAARAALAALSSKDADDRLLAAAAEGEAAIRVELLRAIAARRIASATPMLLKSAADPDDAIRRAAFDALAVVGAPECYPKLIGLLAAAQGDTQAPEKAVLAVGARLANPADRAAPLIAALKTASAQAKASLLRVLGATGGADALQAVRACLSDADAAVRDAALRSLASWPDAAPAGDLLKLARDSESPVHRVLALRGYLHLASEEKDEAARLKMLEQIRPIATTTESKKLLLGALGEAPDAGALQVAASFLDDAEVRAEAAAAALRIGQAIVGSDRQAVVAAMTMLVEKCKDEAVVKQAEALHAQALKPPRAGGAGSVPDYDKKRSDGMKADVAKRAPKGFQVVAYLNCGPDATDGEKGKPTLRVGDAQAYRWAGADIRYGTIFYTGDVVTFEASSLNPKKAYQLGFSWWDCDHDTRAQSVWAATAKGEKNTKLVDKTKLPSGQKGEKPAEKVVPIPQELTTTGGVRITFRNEAQPNCVVSEVWLLESEAEGPKGEAGAPGPQKANPDAKKVLIVTGVDSAHNWKATMRPLADLLEKDPRLACRIVEDPNFLASDEINNYDVVVIHFQNPKPLEKGVEGGKNLLKFVEGGKGVVIVHFGCGALREWPDFVKVAGRVWDPKMRAHDPRGPFKVNITDVKHPITEGMTTFDTNDELYTCLAGDSPVEVLAVATSKVDKKDYPMALVANVGKGRSFHCALGHDPKALSFPGVAELYRRGAAWAAGLPPVPPTK